MSKYIHETISKLICYIFYGVNIIWTHLDPIIVDFSNKKVWDKKHMEVKDLFDLKYDHLNKYTFCEPWILYRK